MARRNKGKGLPIHTWIELTETAYIGNFFTKAETALSKGLVLLIVDVYPDKKVFSPNLYCVYNPKCNNKVVLSLDEVEYKLVSEDKSKVLDILYKALLSV